MTSTNVGRVKALYAAFAAKDERAIRAIMDPEIQWIQNPGFPGGGHQRGVDSVLANSFARLRTEWTGWRARVDEYLDAGGSVVAIGAYLGTHATTGKAMEAAFAHVYDLREGRIVRMRQFTDTAMIERASRGEGRRPRDGEGGTDVH